MEFTLKSDIRLRGSESAQNISSEIALLAHRWDRKGRAIENFPAGIVTVGETPALRPFHDRNVISITSRCDVNHKGNRRAKAVPPVCGGFSCF
jgi:hypothetical protein